MIKKNIQFFLFLFVFFGAISDLAAHPGHGYGGGSFTLLHYLMEPMHVIIGLLLLAVITTTCACWAIQHKSRLVQLEKAKAKRRGF